MKWSRAVISSWTLISYGDSCSASYGNRQWARCKTTLEVLSPFSSLPPIYFKLCITGRCRASGKYSNFSCACPWSTSSARGQVGALGEGASQLLNPMSHKGRDQLPTQIQVQMHIRYRSIPDLGLRRQKRSAKWRPGNRQPENIPVLLVRNTKGEREQQSAQG